MFREMRRIKQKLSDEESLAILKNERRGVLCVQGDDGYPYGLPIDYWYDEESGKICFHGAKQGHKIDSINRSDKASFCVYDEGYRKDGEWFLNIKSVIIFGRIKAVEDEQRAETISRNLAYKFTNDNDYIDLEIKNNIKRVKCLELTPEHITGKSIKES